MAPLPAAAIPGYKLDGLVQDYASPGQTTSKPVTQLGTTTDVPGGASATFNLGADPNLTGRSAIGPATSASSISEVGTFQVSNGGGIAGYYFQVVGPTGTALLQIQASGSVSVTNSPFNDVGVGPTFTEDVRSGLAVYPGGPNGPNAGSAYLIADFSQISAGYSGGQGYIAPSQYNNSTPDVTGTLATGFNGGWTDNRTFGVSTNTLYFVNFVTYVNLLGQSTPGSISGVAIVDPTFTIVSGDPSDMLQFSPGVTSATAMPEPASLAVLATGLVGFVTARARKRSQTPM